MNRNYESNAEMKAKSIVAQYGYHKGDVVDYDTVVEMITDLLDGE